MQIRPQWKLGFRLYLREIKAMKYLIFGLGNMHLDYMGTRHNVGFEVVDALASALGAEWHNDTHSHRAEARLKGRTLILFKPTTYMNLSGKCVRYWLLKERIEPNQILVITDDLNLEFGSLRIRGNGSDGGHNGLKDIQAQLGSTQYPRMRVGIGSNFPKGRQVDYVLGKWNDNEQPYLAELMEACKNAAVCWALEGISAAMNKFNGVKIGKP